MRPLSRHSAPITFHQAFPCHFQVSLWIPSYHHGWKPSEHLRFIVGTLKSRPSSSLSYLAYHFTISPLFWPVRVDLGWHTIACYLSTKTLDSLYQHAESLIFNRNDFTVQRKNVLRRDQINAESILKKCSFTVATNGNLAGSLISHFLLLKLYSQRLRSCWPKRITCITNQTS